MKHELLVNSLIFNILVLNKKQKIMLQNKGINKISELK